VETIDAYLEALASAEPTPGGGSAATIVAAAGAALVAMVARITLANAKRSATHPLASQLVEQADGMREHLLLLRKRDEEAYAAVVAAQALPRTSDAEKATRSEAVQAALKGAAETPLESAKTALSALALAERALSLENDHLISDVLCAAEFASAGVRGAIANVRINNKYIRDTAYVARSEDELVALEEGSTLLLKTVRRATSEPHPPT
jgi:formiminotetrahydrofolate cyclodeaminase